MSMTCMYAPPPALHLLVRKTEHELKEEQNQNNCGVWLQALVAADSQLWDRAMSEASPTRRPGGAPDERDDEWLLVLAEPRATNLLAVASVTHEFVAGALFVPVLESAELLPSTSVIRWAHKNWMSQVRRHPNFVSIQFNIERTG